MSQQSTGHEGNLVGQDGGVPRQGGEVVASQEADFQHTARINVRQRIGPLRQTLPDPVPDNVETEESTCSICYELWTNSGSHRLVAIKCGHMFGESCIIKWIQQQTSKSNQAKCPSCNTLTKRNDIRRLWSKNVSVLDTSERDEALAKARKETELRMVREQELVQSRMAIEMLKGELSQLKRQHDHQRSLKRKYKATIKRMRLSDPGMDAIAKKVWYTYKPAHTVRLTEKRDGYQHMSYRSSEEMLVCSRHLENGSYGLFKISMRDYSTSMYAPIVVHSLPIKDVQCYNAGKGLSAHDNRSLVLTTSLDKTLRLTSVASNSVVMTYDMQASGWSCCWSSTEPYTMYAATKSSESAIFVYDIRSTRGHVAKYTHTTLLGLSPIHSLCHIGSLGGQKDRPVLLCGNMEGVVVMDLGQLNRHNASEGGGRAGNSTLTSVNSSATMSCVSFSQQSSSSQVPLSQELADRTDRSRGPTSKFRLKESSCWSVSYDRESEQWMGSFRFKDSHRPAVHVLGSIVPNEEISEDSEYSAGHCLWRLEPRTSFEGSQPPRGFGRSCITTRRDGTIHSAAGSQNEIVVYTEMQKSTGLRTDNGQEPAMTNSISNNGSKSGHNFVSQQSHTNRVVLELGDGAGQTTSHLRPELLSTLSNGIVADCGLFIKDVKSITMGQDEYLCSLSDKEVRLFRWSTQSPTQGDDDDDDDDSEVDGDERDPEEAKDKQTGDMGQNDYRHQEPQRGRRGTEEDGEQGRPPLSNVRAASGSQGNRQQHGHEQHAAIVIDDVDDTPAATSSLHNEEEDEGEDEALSEQESEASEIILSDIEQQSEVDDFAWLFNGIDEYDIDTYHDRVWAWMERNH